MKASNLTLIVLFGSVILIDLYALMYLIPRYGANSQWIVAGFWSVVLVILLIIKRRIK